MLTKRQKKEIYAKKLRQYFDDYKGVLIINVDNVGSNQMQQVRIALRGKAVVLLGKNTLIRKVMRDVATTKPQVANLIPYVRGNMGFVFSNGNLAEIRKQIMENKVPASAKSGAIAPVDVWVPPGPTGLDPGQTSFFQALNIATKIQKGSIEIVAKVHLIKVGDKVTSSAVALLSKLNIRPFFYGVKVFTVYEDGTIYDAAILDLSDDDLLAKFFRGVSHVAAISLAVGYPTSASVPHSIINGFKKLLAIAFEIEYMFKEAQEIKDKGAGGGGSGSDSDSGSGSGSGSDSDSSSSSSSAGGMAGMFGDGSGGDGSGSDSGSGSGSGSGSDSGSSSGSGSD